jgi:hypothetical protein
MENKNCMVSIRPPLKRLKRKEGKYISIFHVFISGHVIQLIRPLIGKEYGTTALSLESLRLVRAQFRRLRTEKSRSIEAEASQNSTHNLPDVSRILSAAKNFYFWRGWHIACTVNADSERKV